MDEDYDMGGNLLKARLLARRVPERPEEGPFVRWQGNDPEVIARVGELLRDGRFPEALSASKEQMFYLANLAPEAIGEQAPQVYAALDRMGMGGFVPADNREHALAPEAECAPPSMPGPR